MYSPIREATRVDWPEIREFFRDLDNNSLYRYFNGHISSYGINRLWSKFEQRNSDTFFVVEHLGYIVGVCHIARDGSSAEIGVIVHPEHRSRGHGTALVNRAISWCKVNGITDLLVYSSPSNTIIQDLVQQAGIRPLMLTHAEARFQIPAPDWEDLRREVNQRLVNYWLTFVKHFLFRALMR